MANDYFASKGWLTNYAKAEDSTGAWQKYVAEVERSEMDNFNTPDLDQGSDSILRPGETLDDFDVTFRRPNAQGGRIGFNEGLSAKKTDKVLLERLQAYNDKALQRSSQALYDKYGQDVVDAASKEKFGVPYNEFKPKNDPKGNKRSNFRLKFMSDMKKYGRYISPAESASVGANKRSLDEAKIKLNIIEATKEGNPLNVEQFTKDNDITVKELKKQTKTLQKNIYIKRSLVSGKDSPNKLFWLTDDLTATDNVLKTLTKQKLIINDVDSIDNIMFNAFGREFEEGTTNIKNPNYNIEKYSAIQKNLSEYRTLNTYIDKTYGIKTELDHPLSKKIIRQLMNGTAEELSRVNILEKNLNQQFKNQLNINYSKALDSGNIKQKRAVEEIAEKFKLNIGSVPDDQFFDVSKIDRGAPSFETLDIKKEMLKSLKNAASLDTEFLKYIKENPGVFEDAQINISKIVKPKNVSNIAKNLPEIEKYLNSTVTEFGSKSKKGKAAIQALAIIAGSTGAAVADDGSEGTGGMLKDAAIAGGAIGTVGTKAGRKLLGNLFNVAGLPASIAFNYFAGIDGESSLDRSILGFELATAPGTLAAAKSVTDKIPNKILKKAAQVATGSTPFFLKAAKIAQPVGIATLGGELVNKVIKESEPNYYIDPKTQEPTFYDRENAADVFPSMIDANEQAYKIAKERGISYEDAVKEIDYTRFKNLKND
jgi:hypothetical protein